MNIGIKELRETGHKVRVGHQRFYNDTLLFKRDAENMYGSVGRRFLLQLKGGITTVLITTPSGEILEGKAECSRKDAYDRKKGLMIALGRAFKAKETNA